MGCLALNASYEPLTLVPARRAVRLVLDRKAEVLEVDAQTRFRSERDDLPSPTVIRLVRFVHVPRRLRRQVTNTFLFARDDYRCQYCGCHRKDLRGRQFLTRDHVVPVSQGGGNEWANVVTACSPCNHRKANRTPKQARMPLVHAPGEPNHVHLVWAVRRVTEVQARWIAMFYGEEALEMLKGEDAGDVTPCGAPGTVTPGTVTPGTVTSGNVDMGGLPDWTQSSIQAYGLSQS